MPQFVIYKYDFKEGDKTLFSSKTGKSALEEAQEHFAKLLGSKQMNLYQMEKNNTESTIYKNDIFGTRNGITLMTVCKEKEVSIWKDYKELKESSFPFCHVIIDNREGVCQMAIEQAKAFKSDTDKVRDILQESIQRELTEMGIKFEIRPKMKVKKFWEMVEEQRTVRKDVIKKVEFEFPHPDKVKGMDATPNMSDRLKIFASIAESMGATKGKVTYENSSETGLHMERTSEDIAQMVSLCCNNAYHIAVHFRDMGIYRYGDLVKAMFAIEEKMLTDFSSGQMSMGEDSEKHSFTLCDRMEDIRNLTKDYNDEQKLKPRGKGKAKR